MIEVTIKKRTRQCEVRHMIAGIGRFRNLSKLAISQDHLLHNEPFVNPDLASLAQLSNSQCTELEVSCLKLLKPESIVDVIRNFKEVKTMKLFCEVELTEAICKNLAKICASQKREIVIVLEKEIIDDVDFDFKYIAKFNKEHGAYVKIKTELNIYELE